MSLGFGFGLQYSRLSGGGSGFDPTYQAVIDYANSESLTLPNSTIQGLQNDFMVSINPFFNKFKALNLWAGEAGLGGFKSIDFARLSKVDYYNSPLLLANGIKGNGTSSYVDLKFDADANTTVDSVSFGFFAPNGIVRTSGSKSVLGGRNSNNFGLLYILTNNINTDIFITANTPLRTVNTTITDELISVTNNGTNLILRKNETQLDITNAGADLRDSASVFLLARNNNGTAIQLIDDVISLNFVADELTASELGILSNATKTYLSEI